MGPESKLHHPRIRAQHISVYALISVPGFSIERVPGSASLLILEQHSKVRMSSLGLNPGFCGAIQPSCFIIAVYTVARSLLLALRLTVHASSGKHVTITYC